MVLYGSVTILYISSLYAPTAVVEAEMAAVGSMWLRNTS